MTDKQSAIVIRFAVQDGQKVTEALKKLEQDGAVSFRKFGENAQQSSRSVGLLSGAADELRSRMTGLAGGAGSVGNVFASGSVKALAFAAALGVVVAGLRAFISSAPALVANADAAGLSLERYQSLRAAIIDSGGNAEQASQGLRQFAVQMRSANLSTGDLYESIRKINPEYARALALSKDLGEAQRIVVKAMDDASLASQKAAIGNAAFGESWRFVVNGIRRDQAGLVSAERIISPELVQRAADVSAKINSIVDAISTRFLSALKPAVELLQKFLADLDAAERRGPGAEGERSEVLGHRMRIWGARRSGNTLSPADQSFADMEGVVRRRAEAQKKLDDLNREFTRIEEEFLSASERLGRARNQGAAPEDLTTLQLVHAGLRSRKVAVGEERKQVEEELQRLDAEEERVRRRYQEQQRRPQVPVITVRARPEAPAAPTPAAAAEEARQAEIRALSNEQAKLQKKAAAMGEATSATDRQRLAEIALRLAALDRVNLTQRDIELTRSMTMTRLEAERIAARTSLGIATEEERLAVKQREVANSRRLGIIRTDEEAARVLALYRKELRETINQEQVRGSMTPGLTKMRQDATRDLRLDIDEAAVGSLNEFNSALFSTARGYKDAKTAALDFGASVLTMMAQILLKRQIMGPLAGALSGAVESFAKGFFVSSAMGNVVGPGGAMELSRYALGGVHSSPGGVARRPTLSLFGEGRVPEAYVPLPDGRSIPVTIDQRNAERVNPIAPASAYGGGAASVTNNFSIEPPAGHQAEVQRKPNATGGNDVRVVFRDLTRQTVSEDFRDGGPISEHLKRPKQNFR